MKHYLFFLISILFISCTANNSDKANTYLNHIKDEKVAEVLDQAISYAGGLDNWTSLKKLKYKKHSILFLSDSTIESEVKQSHSYSMHPSFSAMISWKKDSNAYQINYGPDSVGRMINNEYDPNADKTSLSKTVMSALFVLGMPFKLLDKGSILSYQGTTLFKDSVETDIIHVQYSSEKNKNHSTDDLWWFYFEKNSGKYLGSKVFHTPTYALIENLGFTDQNTIKFPTHRKSYRTDSLGNIQFLRAEFWYSDYSVKRN